MKKLEDIPKKNIFEVPDGYFDRLPGVVQSRISATRKNSFQWIFALRYAIPVLVIAVAGILWFTRGNDDAPGNWDKLEESQLAIFLNDTELTAEDLAESVNWSSDDLAQLEDEVYATLEISNEDIENVLNEF
jgi:hypothetical protein